MGSVVPPRDSGRVPRVSVGVTRDARATARESVGVTERFRRCTESGRRHDEGVRRYGERLHRRGERRSRRDLGVCRYSEGAPRRGSGGCRHTERPLSRYRERQSLNRGTPWSKLAGRSAFLGSLSVHRGRLSEFVARNSRESLSREVERATLARSREALWVYRARRSVRLETPSMRGGLLCERLGRPEERVGRLLPEREALSPRLDVYPRAHRLRETVSAHAEAAPPREVRFRAHTASRTRRAPRTGQQTAALD